MAIDDLAYFSNKINWEILSGAKHQQINLFVNNK